MWKQHDCLPAATRLDRIFYQVTKFVGPGGLALLDCTSYTSSLRSSESSQTRSQELRGLPAHSKTNSQKGAMIRSVCALALAMSSLAFFASARTNPPATGMPWRGEKSSRKCLNAHTAADSTSTPSNLCFERISDIRKSATKRLAMTSRMSEKRAAARVSPDTARGTWHLWSPVHSRTREMSKITLRF